MTRNKTNLLVREIAVLFSKYSLEDWAPVISELKNGGTKQSNLARAIEDLTAIVPKNSQGKRKRAKTVKIFHEPIKFRELHQKILEPLQESLNDRKILNSISGLNKLFYDLGIKAPISKDRNVYISMLLSYLDELDSEKFEDAINHIYLNISKSESAFGSEYQRWFDVITKS